jgi:hypothetical protein
MTEISSQYDSRGHNDNGNTFSSCNPVFSSEENVGFWKILGPNPLIFNRVKKHDL